MLGVVIDKTEQTSDWSRPLSDQQLAYAAADVAHLLRLREVQSAELARRSLAETMRIESALLPVIVGMGLAGVPVDVAALETIAAERARESTEARVRVCTALRIDNPNSPKQLLPALIAIGLDVDATNKEALAEHQDHPIVRDLQRMRTSKTTADHAASLAKAARDGRVRPSWRQIAAPTGRMATKDPNMLGLPKDPGLRACIAAPPGRTLIIADYGAIELRVIAHVVGDKRLSTIFQAGGDPHRTMAARMYGKAPAEVTKEERDRAKPVNFGFAYGLGPAGFVRKTAAETGIFFTQAEAHRFRTAYLTEYRQVHEWQQKTRARMDREVRTVAGRVWDFPDPREGYTQRLNMPIQGTACDGMKRAMALLAPRLAKHDAQILLVVHDEFVVEAPEAVAEEVKAIVVAGMIEGMAVDVSSVPIVVAAVVSRTWVKP